MTNFHNIYVFALWYLAVGVAIGAANVMWFFRYINSKNVKRHEIPDLAMILNDFQRKSSVIPACIAICAFVWPYVLYILIFGERSKV